jgi:hypothetical protein
MIFHNLFMKHTGIVMNTCPLLQDGPEMVAHLERMNVFIAQGIICTAHGDGIGAVLVLTLLNFTPWWCSQMFCGVFEQ